MRKLMVIFSVIFLQSFMIGCIVNETPQEREERIEEQRAQLVDSWTNRIVGNIRYIKDPRTDTCFAYYWGGSSHGGPSLATIPCEKIPEDLLRVSSLEK